MSHGDEEQLGELVDQILTIARPYLAPRMSVGNDTYGITRIPNAVAGRGVERRVGLTESTRFVYPGSGHEDA